LISSPNKITEVKVRNMRWAGHVAGMDKKNCWWENLKRELG
jgi:hypothetical protein